MSVKIRLKRMGTKKKPFYRIVATDSRAPRDGRFIENLGFYNPLRQPSVLEVQEDLVFKWLDRGAIPSENVTSLLRRIGYMQKWELMKQGVKGAELDKRVAEITSQQAAAVVRRKIKKKAAASAKAKPRAEKETETPEKPAKAETKGEPKPVKAEPKPAKAESKAPKAEPKPAKAESKPAKAESKPAKAPPEDSEAS